MITHFIALGLLDGASSGEQPQPPAISPSIFDSAQQAQSFVTDFGLVSLAQRRQMAEARRRLEARMRAQQAPRGPKRQAIERAQRLLNPGPGLPPMTAMERLALARRIFG